MKSTVDHITKPAGFLASGIKSGVKKSGKHDLGILFCPEGATFGAVYTQNKAAAAPVLWNRELATKSQTVKALIVNSGNANACTGAQGKIDASKMVELTAQSLGVDANEVLICSTGVIGQFLPMPLIEKGIFQAAKELDIDKGENFSLAIQTTDSFQKHSAVRIDIDGHPIHLCGIAKGSGMIHPNMATMLTFITTDATIDSSLLQKVVKEAADCSFNRVVVDGDTSTNDSMIVLASGKSSAPKIEESSPFYAIFCEALQKVSIELAKQIAKDGEGATKFLEITVTGTKNNEDATKAALALAKSPLVKTAFYGEDPNWGRIICAAGYSGAEFNVDEAALFLGEIPIMNDGMGVEWDETALQAVMAQKEIVVHLVLGKGSGASTVWTCDFSTEYVEFNGKYRT
ncbi:MAG: bifunctional glutamate N-acetyltransferase/amino-acid acetyltransferase ArgJ [Brevinema sp.]